MKKIIISLMLFVMVIGLVGCKKKTDQTPNEGGVTVEDFKRFLRLTKESYEDSENGNVIVTVNDGTTTTTMEYIYNYNSYEIESLMILLTTGETRMEGYVKDGYDYVNLNGDKTKASLDSQVASKIIEQYSFTTVTKQVFDTFDQSLLKAFKITSDKDGVVIMVYDQNKHTLDTNGLEEEEVFEATDRYDSIKENVKSITLVLNYSNNKITKLESTWVSNKDVTSTLNLELKGTADDQAIDFPSDLDSYAPRA
jgi:hypothetical protein